jgi:N-acetylneuraminic acid mutarotase
MGKGYALLLILVCLTSSMIIVAPPVSGATLQENSWVEKAPMPTARGYLDAAVVNGKIYAIGGGGPIGTNEEYDPATDMWTTKSPMPTSEQSFAIAVFQDKIYCIGGLPYGNTGLNQVYDPATDTWTTKTPLPTARYGLQANVVDGKIYLMGGVKLNEDYNQGFRLLNITEVYDPSSDTWTTKSPMPNPAGYVSAVINDEIYVIGPGLTQIYKPKTDTWSTGTPFPTNIYSGEENGLAGGANGVAAAAAATTGVMAPKRIYVYDGSYLQVYDPQNNSWAFGVDPPISRQYLSIAVVNDTLYFIGGFTYTPPGFFNDYTNNEQYTPIGHGTISPESAQMPFPTTTFIVVSVAVAVVAIAGSLVYHKKHKRSMSKNAKLALVLIFLVLIATGIFCVGTL